MNTPVTFEIAKLLKEKGFNYHELYQDFANEYDYLVEGSYHRRHESDFPIENYPNSNTWLPVPYIYQVVMWLYEKHGIWINAWSDTNLYLPEWKDKAKWFYVINCDLIQCYNLDTGEVKNLYKSPTEAYLAAIEHCLKEII